MPFWLTLSLALIFVFVSTFLLTWSIREGGSFAFLIPSTWRKKTKPPADPKPEHDGAD